MIIEMLQVAVINPSVTAERFAISLLAVLFRVAVVLIKLAVAIATPMIFFVKTAAFTANVTRFVANSAIFSVKLRANSKPLWKTMRRDRQSSSKQHNFLRQSLNSFANPRRQTSTVNPLTGSNLQCHAHNALLGCSTKDNCES